MKIVTWMMYSIFPGEFLIGFSDGTSRRYEIVSDSTGSIIVPM